MYADNAVIFYASKDVSDIESVRNLELSSTDTGLMRNDKTKTEYVLFGSGAELANGGSFVITVAGYKLNFQKYPHGQIDSFGSPYDITSIMHLPRDAFAKSKSLYTIVARAGTNIVLGQRLGLSPVDNYQLNTLYNCALTSGCLKAQGLQTGVIRDTAMIASSSKRRYYPGQGRLHNSPSRSGNGAWCPNDNDKQPWIQVDLGQIIKVTGIATQGLMSYTAPSYTDEYEVFYKQIIYQYWAKYRSMSPAYGLTQNLPGNWDENSVQYNALTPYFNARYIRIKPHHWFGAPCIRIEIYGCKV